MTDFQALALLPPAVAIVAAMVTRRVYQSLLLGIFVAGGMVAWDASSAGAGRPFAAIAGGFMLTVQWIVDGLATSGHAAVIGFTLFLGALVALMQRSGGIRGFGEAFIRIGAGRRGAMGFAAVIGTMFLAIDDYFHVIAAGSIFRPVTDGARVSREKLSYIIDSTAAPMVILVPISTWAGYILGVINNDVRVDGRPITDAPFAVFLQSIPWNFYAILTVLFVFFIAFTGTDFGPMARAERRALAGKLQRDGARPLLSRELDEVEPALPPRARNLVLPVAFLVVSTIMVLAATGYDASDPGADTPWEAIQNTGVPELSLAISSFLTLLFAMTLYAFQGLRQDDFLDTALRGFKAMMPALAILALAWGIGNAIDGVGLASWLATGLGSDLEPALVPLIAFVLASAIAFSTGTSFGTFAIMIPVSLPVALAAGGQDWLGPVLAASIGGAVFGDHCSPISDTTVMSSMAAQADHIDHVRTQLPYALSVAGVAAAGYGALALWANAGIAWTVNGVLMGVLVGATFFASRRYT